MSNRIRLKRDLCPGPFECGLCLEACREGVLMARPITPFHGRERSWKIVSVMAHRCDGCGKCLSRCPAGAITM